MPRSDEESRPVLWSIRESLFGGMGVFPLDSPPGEPTLGLALDRQIRRHLHHDEPPFDVRLIFGGAKTLWSLNLVAHHQPAPIPDVGSYFARFARLRAEPVAPPDSMLRRCFEYLVERWRADTQFTSSLSEIWAHPAYEIIILMGERVIPLILESVAAGGAFWERALVDLTGENPAIATETPDEARTAWTNWGEERGWITP